MKKILISAMMASAAAWAVPTVSDVSMARQGDWVAVTYTLAGGPAVVTLDVQTNGVSIGREAMGVPVGDGHVLVENGTHTMKWRPGALYAVGVKTLNAKPVLKAWSRNRLPDYLVCDLTGADVPRHYADEADLPGGCGATNRMYKTDKLLMRFIPAKDVVWIKGCSTNEPGYIRWNTEYNDWHGQIVGNFGGEMPYQVRLTQNYYMGVFEVTQDQYQRVTGSNPSLYTEGDDPATRPVERVAYSHLRGTDGAVNWPAGGHAVVGDSLVLAKFRARTRASLLDLPTEAQWEFACHAGTTTPFADGHTLPKAALDAASPNSEFCTYVCAELNPLGRYVGNAAGVGTANVGSYRPNAWGLYDMHGNVYEWCLDYCGVSPAPADGSIAVDPDGGTAAGSIANTRVLKGGSHLSSARCSRVAARRFQSPGGATDGDGRAFLGFRLCLTIE